MPLPFTGVPGIVAAQTASVDSALAVLSSREVWTLGELTIACLRQFAGPASVFIDVVRGKVFASDSEMAKLSIMEEMSWNEGGKLIVSPVNNKFLSPWAVAYSDYGPYAEFFHANNLRPLQKVIDKFAPDFQSAFVNQDDRNVTFFNPNDGQPVVDAMFSAGLSNGGLTFEMRDKNTSTLVFE